MQFSGRIRRLVDGFVSGSSLLKLLLLLLLQQLLLFLHGSDDYRFFQFEFFKIEFSSVAVAVAAVDVAAVVVAVAVVDDDVVVGVGGVIVRVHEFAEEIRFRGGVAKRNSTLRRQIGRKIRSAFRGGGGGFLDGGSGGVGSGGSGSGGDSG